MSIPNDFEVKYTLAFCIFKKKVLMIFRKNPPNANLWNGLGGKIEKGETPSENIKRELLEEAGIEVKVSKKDYKGIVKWNIHDEKKIGGTYLFIIHLDEVTTNSINFDSNEGSLEWKHHSWVSDLKNTELVENIPYFFPKAVIANEPKIYEFFYQTSNQLIQHSVSELPGFPAYR